jgi:hypothetical protein
MNPAISPAPLSTSTAASTWRSAFRTAVVLLLAGLFAVQFLPDLLIPWHPWATFGFDPGPGGIITNVIPATSAAAAGLRPGDRIVLDQLGIHERRRVIYLSMAPPGERVTFPIERDGVRRNVTLSATVFPRSLADNITNAIEVLERVVFLAIAVLLVLTRPSFLTWTFFFVANGSGSGAAEYAFAPDAWIVPLNVLLNVALIASPCASVAFAMLFPRPEPSPRERAVLVALAVAFSAIFAFDTINGYAIVFGWATHGSASHVAFVDRISVTSIAALYAAVVVAFIINYARSPQPERLRMQWVALGFSVASVCAVLPSVLATAGVPTPPLAVVNVLLSMNVLIPITVAYAILKHRVIDVRFFISRALVYGTLTTVAVGLLALLDFVVARRLEETGLSIFIETAGAVAIGIGVHRLHSGIDMLVDRYVFRSMHEAEKRLELAGRSMMFAQTPYAIDERLVHEACAALQLTNARVIRDCNPDDAIVMDAQAQRAPAMHDDEFVVPMFVRHRLIGLAFFGPHRSGAAIDPAERVLLEQLAGAAAIAYDHVTSEERLAENERLRTEVEVLRSLVASRA